MMNKDLRSGWEKIMGINFNFLRHLSGKALVYRSVKNCEINPMEWSGLRKVKVQ